MRSNELLAIFNRNYDQLWAELTHPLARRVYAPLIARIAAGPLTIAQVGQSLDGRIATRAGIRITSTAKADLIICIACALWPMRSWLARGPSS